MNGPLSGINYLYVVLVWALLLSPIAVAVVL